MGTNTYKGKVLSFSELTELEKIEIPIIQRDYAQGREDKKELRENFLKALFDCIKEEKPIKLDFIYGSRINSTFQPLDGQQRLTTLFLLHWYGASKDSIASEKYKKHLANFTYETRITSRDFCLSLIENIVPVSDTEIKLSDKIIDSNWFFLSWKDDPTIDAMLRTIDNIHTIFYSIPDLWSKLISTPNLISFYYVELENIGLTDDLYIKMNARGKLLTPFENFKASFQKYVEDELWEDNLSLENSFALKIDTSWTDFFWHNFKKNNTIDESFMRLFAAIAMIRHSIERTLTKSDERISLINKLQEQPNSVRPENFTKQSFDYLCNVLEIYKDNLNALDLDFPFWRHSTRTSIISEIVFEDNIYSQVQVNSATYTQKILFFAQTEYLKRNLSEFNSKSFHEWMRVIRNIVSRADIDKDGNRPDIIRSPQTFDGGINLINELADLSDNIYDKLANGATLRSQFAKDQIEEERNKAKLIMFSDDYKKAIFEAEDNELLRGKIEFIFYCMNYDYNPSNFDIDLFTKIKDVINKYFSSENSLNNNLRRAFLCMNVNGHYEFYNYWWSYWHTVGATKRRLFDKFRELEYFMASDYREYFKNLVLQLINQDIQQIIDNFTAPEFFPNWKLRLIKEPALLDINGKSNYIAIEDDNSACWLLKSKRPRDIDGCFKVE